MSPVCHKEKTSHFKAPEGYNTVRIISKSFHCYKGGSIAQTGQAAFFIVGYCTVFFKVLLLVYVIIVAEGVMVFARNKNTMGGRR